MPTARSSTHSSIVAGRSGGQLSDALATSHGTTSTCSSTGAAGGTPAVATANHHLLRMPPCGGELLTEVRPPTVEEEVVRDLVRLRASAGEDVRRAKQRLGKMLLRYGLVYRQGTNWTLRHLTWIRQQRLSPLAQEVLGAHLAELERLVEPPGPGGSFVRARAQREPRSAGGAGRCGCGRW